MAASFGLGASGVVLGTRLNATYESVYPEAKKQALVKAGSSASQRPSTIRTTLYDELSGVPWPPAVDGSCLVNELTSQYSNQTPLQVRLLQTADLIAILDCAQGGQQCCNTCVCCINRAPAEQDMHMHHTRVLYMSMHSDNILLCVTMAAYGCRMQPSSK